MDIILDTNILMRDYQMKGAHFRVLIDGLSRTDDATIRIPQVVVAELLANYRDQLTKLNADAQALSRDWKRYAEHHVELTTVDIDHLCEIYFPTVITPLLRWGGLIEWPSVAHESVTKRIAGRRKPSRNGNGYRDVLIWESVLEHLASTTDSVIFITDNTKDFAGEDRKLHPDLIEDARERGIDPSRITLMTSLGELNAKIFEPKLKQLNGVAEQLNAHAYPGFDITQYLTGEIPKELDAQLLDIAVEELQGDDTIELDAFSIVEATVTSVAEMSDGEMLVTVDVTASADIRVVPSDGYQHPRHGRIGGTPERASTVELQIEVDVVLAGSSPIASELITIEGPYGRIRLYLR